MLYWQEDGKMGSIRWRRRIHRKGIMWLYKDPRNCEWSNNAIRTGVGLSCKTKKPYSHTHSVTTVDLYGKCPRISMDRSYQQSKLHTEPTSHEKLWWWQNNFRGDTWKNPYVEPFKTIESRAFVHIPNKLQKGEFETGSRLGTSIAYSREDDYRILMN